MIQSFWGELKSGTDIRGIALKGVEDEHVNLTCDVVKTLSVAFAVFVSEKTNKKSSELKISVGHDPRISADNFRKCIVEGLVEIGVSVIDTGLSSTPAMFMTTIDLNCDGAIEITASHHPYNRNGLKFFTKDSGLDEKDIEKILEIAQSNSPLKIETRGSCTKLNYMDQYSNNLKEIIKTQIKADNFDRPLEGLKIVVDAGNGAGGFYAYSVLEPLGADVSASQFLEPDGNFPNHVPNPENADAMNSLKTKVIEEHADLGVIFDTDVDRCGAVDKSGQEINRNKLIALASLIALEENTGGTIVTDSITSQGLTKYIEKKLGGVHHRFKRGYRNVINESKRLNALGINSPLAIETSGHAAFRENYFLDDGAYLMTKIIIKLAKLKNSSVDSIGSLINDLEEPKESLEKRIPILADNYKQYGKEVIEKLKSYAENQSDWVIDEKNVEGIRVNFKDKKLCGWFLLRLSVHDPVMPLNVESNVCGGVEKILSLVLSFLRTCEDLKI